jgi:uncharacterized protein YceK
MHLTWWTKNSRITVIIVLAILLTGCDNSIKHAKARNQHHATNRADDRHDLAMADSAALTPVRLIVKEFLLWSLMVSGIALMVGGVASAIYFLVGMSFYSIRHKRAQQIPLDIATRQYPLLLYGNGRRIFNPNNGERLLLTDVSEAELPRIEASTKVQLAGLITDNSKIINGPVIPERETSQKCR